MLYRRASLALIACTGLLNHCGRKAEQTPPASTPTPTTPSPSNRPASSSEPSAAAPSAAAQPKNEPAPIDGFTFQRELELPVHSIALADPPLIAVLSDEPQMRDKRGWRKLALPAALRPKPNEADKIEIFFGRDNRPRLMGTRRTTDGVTSVYLRWLDTGWREARDEIGRLGNSLRGGLYGVLGLDDPEVVCRAGDVCIIKRISGWTTIPAGAEPRLVIVRDKTAWSLDTNGVSALSAQSWNVFAPNPPFKTPNAFWSDGKTAWISADEKLFRFSEARWTTHPSPIARPSAFWATSSNRVFMAGANGVAIWDGANFRQLAGAPENLRVIIARGEDNLWLGGDNGLYRVIQPANTQANAH